MSRHHPQSQPAFMTTPGVCYLNTASVALMSIATLSAARTWDEQIAHRGTMLLTETAEERALDCVREPAARLFGARPENIAVGSSFTELLSSLAWGTGWGPGDRIVGLDGGFPSTMYPWLRVSRATGCEITMVRRRGDRIELDDILRAIDGSTRAVCLTHVEFGTGQVHDVAAIAEATHEAGGILILDVTQSAGAIPIDVDLLGVDVLIGSGYKWMCGPFGSAVMYVRPGVLEDIEPALVGFRSPRDMWNLDAAAYEMKSGAQKFEYGTMSYGAARALAQAITELNTVGIRTIHSHNLMLAQAAADVLRELGANTVLGEAAGTQSSIVTARLNGLDPGDTARRLADAGVIVSPRRDMIRVSMHLYNRIEDVDRLADALSGIMKPVAIHLPDRPKAPSPARALSEGS